MSDQLATFDEQVPRQQFADDAKLYVVFFMHPQKQGFESEQAGRPVYKDVPYVKIHIPGDKNNVVVQPVDDLTKQRFPTQWEKFEKGLVQSPTGTPLEQWPQLTVSQVAEFKAVNVQTVEQLAELADAFAGRFMGGHDLKRKAAAFLAVAKDTAEAQRLATENAELKGNVTNLQGDVSRLSAQVEALMAAQSQKVSTEPPSAQPLKGQHGSQRTPANQAGSV